MAEILSLRKDRSNNIVLYPYRDVPDEDWPVYTNTENKETPYSEEWREVGFVLPYPTNKHLSNLGSKFAEIISDEGVTKYRGGDPDGLAKSLVYSTIKGLKGITENGEPINWEEKRHKEWLFGEFQVSAWLLNTLYLAYSQYAGKLKKKEGEDEENFTEPSETTSTESITE